LGGPAVVHDLKLQGKKKSRSEVGKGGQYMTLLDVKVGTKQSGGIYNTGERVDMWRGFETVFLRTPRAKNG